MPRWPLALLLTALTAHAQTAPVLAAPPDITYPPIARAAHISGDVVVTFAINPDGTTTAVSPVSGPPMLLTPTVTRIQHWTFKTPLPLNAQTYFEAHYTFTAKTSDDDEEDNLDTPPFYPFVGDMGITLPGAATVNGDVHSTDGSQTIDVTAAPAKTDNRCPKDANKTAPDKTTFDDYVELLRYACANGCPAYRVRLYRSGRVTWHGISGVAVKGDSEALVDANAADTLINSFASEDFWAACTVDAPAEPPAPTRANPDPDWPGIFLTASIGGLTKTVTADSVNHYDWSLDRVTDTHRWRHVDPALEPYDNIYDDLSTPKPGITLLIRATYHFNPYTGRQTFTYLNKLLQRGEPVDAADASGWTPLMYASYLDPIHYDASQPDPIKLLLAAGADPNRASLHGDTALMFAAYRGTLLQPLLAAGANLNAHNADGVTPLMLLAQQPDPDAIKAALTAGADPTAHDNAGRTALDYLRAASCHKPILPLPASRGMTAQIIPRNPPPCPDTTNPSFLATQSILQRAMAARTSHPTP